MPNSLSKLRENLRILRDKVWLFQLEWNEINYFYEQWDNLFDLLEQQGFKNAKINIRGVAAFQSVQNRLRLLVIDLHSFLVAETAKGHSTLIHMKLLIDTALPFEPQRGQSMTMSDDGKTFAVSDPEVHSAERSAIQLMHDEARIAKLRELTSIVGSLEDEALKIFLKTFANTVDSTRQVFAHRHQEYIVRGNVDRADHHNVLILKGTIEKLFQLIQLVSNLAIGEHSSAVTQIEKGYLDEVLDQTLFGRVETANLNYSHESEGQNAYQHRGNFFKSNRIKNILAKF